MTLIAEILRVIPAMTILEVSLAIVFLAFGIAKFARYEQVAVDNLVADHPVLRFGPKILTATGFSLLLGAVELATAALLFLGVFSATLGMLGGLVGVLTFLVTLSLFPYVQYHEAGVGRLFLSSRGQFLLKDLGLLGGCLAVARDNALNLL